MRKFYALLGIVVVVLMVAFGTTASATSTVQPLNRVGSVVMSTIAMATPDDSASPSLQLNVVRAPFVDRYPVSIFPVSGHDAFPTLARLPNGDIDIAYRHGTDHFAARNGALMISRSVGGVNPFGDPQILRDLPGMDERDPSIAYIQGELWTTWFTGSAALAAEGAWVQRGALPPVRIDSLPLAAIAAPVRELPDGSVGAVFYGRDSGETRDSVWFARSTDGGQTWKCSRLANGQADGRDYQEPWMVIRDGQFIVSHRYGNWDRIGMITSVDGVTWSAPRPVLDSATGRPNMTVLESGVIMMNYRDTVTHHAMLTVSRDGGVSWAIPRILAWAPPGPIGWTYGDLLEYHPGIVLSVFSMENPDGTAGLYRFWISEKSWT